LATAAAVRAEYPIDAVHARAYKIPTEDPEESDGSLKWTSTTLVFVEVHAGEHLGIGYTYADASAATLVEGLLRDALVEKDALETAERYAEMFAKVRNNGPEGIAAMAVSALDIALWDLKGKILNAPVSVLLGAARKATPVYGSGGFTSYSERRLTEQLSRWVHDERIPRVKMKVGRDPDADPDRVAAARKAIGKDAELFVDANGAYSRQQALKLARTFSAARVSWFEEPVYHNDLEGNRFLCERAPPGMEISNGEYGSLPYTFQRIIAARAADVLQADVTRCGGYSGFLAVDGLCQAYMFPLSSHCAPYVTLPVATAAKMLRHIEYFHDHVRIERMLFDGTSDLRDGALQQDLARPGIGLEFKRADAQRFAI
jgi:L-alanine-DL-glutamate epimerase-like enolase superfamily enzyme